MRAVEHALVLSSVHHGAASQRDGVDLVIDVVQETVNGIHGLHAQAVEKDDEVVSYTRNPVERSERY